MRLGHCTSPAYTAIFNYIDELPNMFIYAGKIKQKLLFYAVSYENKEFNEQINTNLLWPIYKTNSCQSIIRDNVWNSKVWAPGDV